MKKLPTVFCVWSTVCLGLVFISLPLAVLLFTPAALIFLAYMIYGLVSRDYDEGGGGGL